MQHCVDVKDWITNNAARMPQSVGPRRNKLGSLKGGLSRDSV